MARFGLLAVITVDGTAYLTLADASARLGVSGRAVSSYIKKGIIPAPESVLWGARYVNVFTEEYLTDAAIKLAEYARRRRRG